MNYSTTSRNSNDYGGDITQYNVPLINMFNAWLNTVTYDWNYRMPRETIIAVVDTGFFINHPDLENVFVDGWYGETGTLEPPACPSNCNDYNTCYICENLQRPHGNMVAGIAAMETNNNLGYAGIAWTEPFRIKLMPIKVGFQYQGEVLCDPNLIWEAIRWACDNGADVINMSWSSNDHDERIENSINYCYDKDKVLIGVTGKIENNETEIKFPGYLSNVITVGGVNGDLTWFSQSKYGPQNNISAPCVNIQTTTINSYGNINSSGVSFAAPQVSGIAALMLSLSPLVNYGTAPYKTHEIIKDMIQATAVDIEDPGFDYKTGWGLIDGQQAIEKAIYSSEHYGAYKGILQIEMLVDIYQVILNDGEILELNAYKIRNTGNGPLYFTSNINSDYVSWLKFAPPPGESWDPINFTFMNAILAPGEEITIRLKYDAGILCNSCQAANSWINFAIYEGKSSSISHVYTSLSVLGNCSTLCGRSRGCNRSFFSVLPFEDYPIYDSLNFYLILLIPLLFAYILKYKYVNRKNKYRQENYYDK